MKCMKVSMDGLRKNAIRAYNKVVAQLKDNIKEDLGPIDQCLIEEPMEDLRNCLVTLAFCSQEGEDGFKELENVNVDSLIGDE